MVHEYSCLSACATLLSIWGYYIVGKSDFVQGDYVSEEVESLSVLHLFRELCPRGFYLKRLCLGDFSKSNLN